MNDLVVDCSCTFEKKNILLFKRYILTAFAREEWLCKWFFDKCVWFTFQRPEHEPDCHVTRLCICQHDQAFDSVSIHNTLYFSCIYLNILISSLFRCACVTRFLQTDLIVYVWHWHDYPLLYLFFHAMFYFFHGIEWAKGFLFSLFHQYQENYQICKKNVLIVPSSIKWDSSVIQTRVNSM